MDILNSLAVISTGYSVFEKDQILTHDQLNSIAAYLDDQSRLTRVDLLGVGIVRGLRVSASGSSVKITKGVGITTDGDLLCIHGEREYDRFKPYGKSRPAYAPFYLNGDVKGSMIPVYELTLKNAVDAEALPLGEFNRTGNSLDSMTAVLFMESYITDRDICSGTDCDNRGQDFKINTKLLLVNNKYLGTLIETVNTPRAAAQGLNEIAAARPLLDATVKNAGQLVQAYALASSSIHLALTAELSKIYPACSSFLADIFPGDPGPQWLATLTKIKADTQGSHWFQYYYDFLKDVAETYNDFRALIASDTTWCCPDPAAFPKHLLLGNLVPGTAPDQNRTGYYPSPAASRTIGHLNHARFLARKMDVLIRTFVRPPVGAVRITPSKSEEHPQEERAIPYYYGIDKQHPIHESWSFTLHRRKMDAFNYSYNASAYGGRGGAAAPLTTQMGKFSFFRIEGHLGEPVSKVLPILESEIRSKNLPFTVNSVLLGADRKKIVIKPPIRYTDLHRFHYLLRQDVCHQLEEVTNFSQNFRQKITSAVKDKLLADSDDENKALTNTTREQNAAVARNASRARAKLNRSYSSYKTDPSWKQNLAPAMEAAGRFKYNLGEVVKTEFATPFDTLINNTHIQWLDWLDQLIKDRDEKEDEKLLFSTFIAQRPEIEHFAGVTRGGTFVLVYDETGTIVADFSLPYYWPDTAEGAQKEPPLQKPGLRPGWVVGNGIKVLPKQGKTMKQAITEHLKKFKDDNLSDIVKSSGIDALLNGKLAEFKFNQLQNIQSTVQTQYLDAMKDAVTLIGKMQPAAGGAPHLPGPIKDPTLGQKVTETKTKAVVIEYMRKKAGTPGLPPETRMVYEKQAREAEVELADAVSKTTQYVADNVNAGKMDISADSDGMAAIVEMNKSMQAITTPETQAIVTGVVRRAQVGATNPNLALVLGSIGFRSR